MVITLAYRVRNRTGGLELELGLTDIQTDELQRRCLNSILIKKIFCFQVLMCDLEVHDRARGRVKFVGYSLRGTGERAPVGFRAGVTKCPGPVYVTQSAPGETTR